MRDPHVTTLNYRFVHPETVDYKHASSVEHETPAFKMHIANADVIFEMKEHHATERSARSVVEQFVEAWTTLAYINRGDEFSLQFKNANIVDRNPPPPESPAGGATIHVRTTATLNFESRVELHVSRGSYPAVPSQFAMAEDVRDIAYFYRQFRAGHDRLGVVAYFTLMILGTHAGDGIKEAAKQYRISEVVLRKLSDLSSNKGGPAESRKKPNSAPFTQLEHEWIEQAIKLFIERAGALAANSTTQLPQITMADLPALP
jgi:hypothetical protein